ncbi:MAG: rubrerythrin, partial [Betaproteobacteria bacterium PRO3]|nr:rubrerythrin [Betaproteobacteria bacterium PRO3]
GGEEAFDPSLNAYDALRYARENEMRAMQYYSDVGLSSNDPAVQRMAAEFAAEETEHVQALDDWLARVERPSAPWAKDPER